MTPSDSLARRPAEFRLPALYPRSPPPTLVDLPGSQAFSLCAVPACCRLHPVSLDGFLSPTHPPPILAFAQRRRGSATPLPALAAISAGYTLTGPIGRLRLLRPAGLSPSLGCVRPHLAVEPSRTFVGPARRDQLPDHARTQTTRASRGIPEAGSFHPASTEVLASHGRRRSARTRRT
jgi:hypothetical protein